MQKNFIPVKIQDPITNADRAQYYGVVEGGRNITYKTINSTSFSNSTCSFTAPPPSTNTFVSRDVLLKCNFRLSFSGTTAGNNLLQSGFDAPRAFPLINSINSTQISINNATFSLNASDVVLPLLRYNTCDKLKESGYSMTPSMLDNFQRYSSGTNTVRNVLSSYSDNSYMNPRGGFNYTVVSNTNTNAVVDLEITENLFLSPFLFGHMDNRGFIGVQNMDFTFNFVSNLAASLWSHSDDAPVLTFNVDSVNLQNAQLLFKYITPQPYEKIPRMTMYPYFQTQRYPTTINTAVAPNATVQIVSDNIQLNSIPNKIYIYARRRNQDKTISTTDTYFAIENINVNWNNESALLSSMNKEDIYKMAVKNGLSGLTYQEWGSVENRLIGNNNELHGLTGSVLALQPGTDIQLKENEAPGVLGKYQLQITATFRNINQNDNIIPTFYIVVIDEGTLKIVDNSAFQSIGVLNEMDVIQAKKSQFRFTKMRDMYGGNFLESLGNKVLDFGSDVGKSIAANIGIPRVLAEKAPELAKSLMPSLPALLGFGSGGRGGKGGKGGKMEKRAGVLVGGKQINRSDLRRRL